MRKTLYILLFVAYGAVSCSRNFFDDAEKVPLVAIGAEKTVVMLEASGQEGSMKIFANGAFHLLGAEDYPWLTLGSLSGDGNMDLSYSARPNDGFRRKALIVLKSDIGSRADTLQFRQEGSKIAKIDVGGTSLLSTGAGGEQIFPIDTNVPFEEMTVDCRYVSKAQEEWVKDISISGDGGTMVINTLRNIADEPRIARIVLGFTDGWDETVRVEFNLIQRNAAEVFGREVSFSELCSEYAGGDVISDYIVLDGWIVSNSAGGNAGQNEQITATTVDYTPSSTTAYLESPDGQKGLEIRTVSAEDNDFDQFDRVKILLKGCVVDKYASPERYTLRGVTRDMVVDRVSGTRADIPVKKKHIQDLTDADIYTYVSLEDVEIPVRKGPVAPINEGYAIGTNANRIDKYPRLVRDINGDVTYLLTNTVCRYRNDGSLLPYGSGILSGVVVHERFVRFEFKNGANILDVDSDPELGFISRYQLRHQTKEDIWGEMNMSVEDSFSALLTEYRFVNPDPQAATTRAALPTYGTNGYLTHTWQEKYTGDPEKERIFQNDMTINFVYTFSYLGPVGNNVNNFFGLNKGNVNGMGIILDPEKEHYPQWASWQNLISVSPDGTKEWCGPYATSEDARNINLYNGGDQPGKAICPWGTRTGFSNRYWWDYETSRPYGWLLCFSTKGITTNHLSLQFTALNYARYTPRFWKIEWSEQDSQDAASDPLWTEVGRYTVPDVTEWSVATVFSLCGYKQYNFNLPLEMLGKDKVWLRFIPVSDVASSGSDYADTHMSEDGKDGHESALDYIAIRYNK